MLYEKASVSIAVNKLNNVRARTQPCLVPFVTSKGLSGCHHQERGPAYHHEIDAPCWWIVMGSQANFSIINHKPVLLTVSTVFVRSPNAVYRLLFCSWYFSCSCMAAKIMSTVQRPERKPHWPSGSIRYSRWQRSLFRTMRARIFPVMDKSEIPRWMSQDFILLLRLQRWTIEASCRVSFSHIEWKSLVSFWTISGPAYL